MTPELERELLGWIRRLAGARTVPVLAEQAAAAATALLGAQGAAFVVRDGDQCEYVGVNSIAPRWWKSQRFPLNDCVCGWTILNGRPAIVPDIFNDERVPGKYYQGAGIKSLLAVPVGGKSPLGAMPIYWSSPHQPSESEIAVASSLADAAATMVDNLRLLTSLERAKAEAEQRAQENERLNDHLRKLIRELDHRVKNNLAVVLSVSEQTYRSSGGGEAFQEAFRGRMMAMARVHEALAASGWRSTRLTDLLASVVSPFSPGSRRLIASGGELMVPSRAIFAVASTLHELSTNACKHGAWSGPAGTVTLAWSQPEPNVLELHWDERCDFPVKTDAKEGFGCRLIRELMPHELGADVTMRFHPTGLEFAATVAMGTVEEQEAWVQLEHAADEGVTGSIHHAARR
jgi:two-component sensor histidine kinase